GATAEAMIELLGRADGERRCFLVVERTAGDQVGASAPQGKVRLDDVGDVGSPEELLNEGFGNHRIGPGRLTREAGTSVPTRFRRTRAGHTADDLRRNPAAPRRRHHIIGRFTSASRILTATRAPSAGSQPVSLALTMADTCAISARPVSSRFSTDMTLPMSCADLAPAVAIARATVLSISA